MGAGEEQEQEQEQEVLVVERVREAMSMLEREGQHCLKGLSEW